MAGYSLRRAKSPDPPNKIITAWVSSVMCASLKLNENVIGARQVDVDLLPGAGQHQRDFLRVGGDDGEVLATWTPSAKI